MELCYGICGGILKIINDDLEVAVMGSFLLIFARLNFTGNICVIANVREILVSSR